MSSNPDPAPPTGSAPPSTHQRTTTTTTSTTTTAPPSPPQPRHHLLKPPTSQISGDPCYSAGTKTYIISQGKISREGLTLPDHGDEKELGAFFKLHADTVVEREKDIPVEKVDAASAVAAAAAEAWEKGDAAGSGASRERVGDDWKEG